MSSTEATDSTTLRNRNELFMGSRLSVRFGAGQTAQRDSRRKKRKVWRERPYSRPEHAFLGAHSLPNRAELAARRRFGGGLARRLFERSSERAVRGNRALGWPGQDWAELRSSCPAHADGLGRRCPV